MTKLYRYHWSNNEVRANRKGQLCRVLARGSRQTVLVRFEDGFQMTTSRRALRRIDG